MSPAHRRGTPRSPRQPRLGRSHHDDHPRRSPPELTELRIAGPIAEVEVVGEDRADVEIDRPRATRTATTRPRRSEYVKAVEADRRPHRLGADPADGVPAGRPAARHAHAQGAGAAAGPRRAGSGTLTVSNVAAVEVAGTPRRGDAPQDRRPGRDRRIAAAKSRSRTSASLELTGRSGTLQADRRPRRHRRSRWTGGRARRRRGSTGAARRRGAQRRHRRSTNSRRRAGRSASTPTAATSRVEGTASRRRASTAATPSSTSTMAAPAPVAIYSEGERVALTPPPGGFTLDARRHGRPDHVPTTSSSSMGFTSTKRASDSQEVARVRRRQGRRPDDHASAPPRRLHHPQADVGRPTSRS